MSQSAPPVIQAEELNARLDTPELIIVDLSGDVAYEREHIPGAVNIDAASVIASRPPVMGLLPPAQALATVLSEAGIRPESWVVVYDSENGLKAARFAWTLDAIGHQRVSLLDGGLGAWLDAGLPTDGEVVEPQPSVYEVQYRDEHIADKDYIRRRLGDPDLVIVDARTPAEYSGMDRRAQRAGHIPGAVNIDWSRALRGNGDLRLLDADQLRALYESHGVTPDKEVIVHCQTHQRSSHSYFALKSLGFQRIRGYPGSWSDWGNDPETPIEA
jgi:thiosulfate/3-mercaptopyruvate sulfurtransferase